MAFATATKTTEKSKMQHKNYVQPQKTPINKNNLEPKEQRWQHHKIRLKLKIFVKHIYEKNVFEVQQ